jgi:hypothetical protein
VQFGGEIHDPTRCACRSVVGGRLSLCHLGGPPAADAGVGAERSGAGSGVRRDRRAGGGLLFGAYLVASGLVIASAFTA